MVGFSTSCRINFGCYRGGSGGNFGGDLGIPGFV